MQYYFLFLNILKLCRHIYDNNRFDFEIVVEDYKAVASVYFNCVNMLR